MTPPLVPSFSAAPRRVDEREVLHYRVDVLGDYAPRLLQHREQERFSGAKFLRIRRSGRRENSSVTLTLGRAAAKKKLKRVLRECERHDTEGRKQNEYNDPFRDRSFFAFLRGGGVQKKKNK